MQETYNYNDICEYVKGYVHWHNIEAETKSVMRFDIGKISIWLTDVNDYICAEGFIPAGLARGLRRRNVVIP